MLHRSQGLSFGKSLVLLCVLTCEIARTSGRDIICKRGEYLKNGYNMDTDRLATGKCTPCEDETYTDRDNISIYCAECDPPCVIDREVETSKCTAVQNRKCECATGFYTPKIAIDRVCVEDPNYKPKDNNTDDSQNTLIGHVVIGLLSVLSFASVTVLTVLCCCGCVDRKRVRAYLQSCMTCHCLPRPNHRSHEESPMISTAESGCPSVDYPSPTAPHPVTEAVALDITDGATTTLAVPRPAPNPGAHDTSRSPMRMDREASIGFSGNIPNGVATQARIPNGTVQHTANGDCAVDIDSQAVALLHSEAPGQLEAPDVGNEVVQSTAAGKEVEQSPNHAGKITHGATFKGCNFVIMNGTVIDNKQWVVKVTHKEAKTELDKLVKDKSHVFVARLDVLMNDLYVGIDLISILRKHKVLSKIQYEEIDKPNLTPSDKAVLTLSYVQRKGDSGLAYFIIALYKSMQAHIIESIATCLREMNNERSLACIKDILTGEREYEEVLKYFLSK